MELRQLEYFVTVVDAGGFTRAAERLHVAQPGISAQVKRLERELGQPLLDRSGRTVRLTAAGAAVLPHARAALAAAAATRTAVDEVTGLVRGRVAVGAVTSHEVDLPGLLAAFHRAHPAVELTLTEAASDRLLAGLRDGTLDAAVLALGAAPVPPDLDAVILTHEELAALVSPGHPLAGRDTVPLRELAEHALISLPRGTGLRACLDEGAALAGFRPQVRFEAGSPLQLADLAARGLGVAIVPRSVTTSRPDLHPVRLTDPALHGRLAFAHARSATPAARAFATLTKAHLRGHG
jgi:DNA-binding transcriptional LysR family regulator